jgi:plasmid maintenance system antidote protein VapI
MKLYNDDTLVSYLKKVMKEEKISQRKFAKMSGVPRSTVQRIVTGENKLTLDNAIKIAKALGMKIELISYGIDKEE